VGRSSHEEYVEGHQAGATRRQQQRKWLHAGSVQLALFPSPQKKNDGGYTMGDETVTPTASQELWFEAIMKRHTDPSHAKLVNSQLKLWAHPDQGYIEVMKLFCNSLGGHDISKNKRCVADLDAEAVFRIIHNCKAFHGAVGPGSPVNPVKAASNDAGFGRNTTIHAPTPNLSEKEYEMVVKQLSSFEQMLVQCGVLDASSRLVCNMKWMEANLADEKHAEIIKLYKNVRGDRLLLLQTAEDAIFELQNEWAPGSREALKTAVTSRAAADDSRVKLLWLHAQRGRGKSSLMAQRSETRAWAPGTTCVVHHFFKRDDASSSLNIATASMCVQLWHHFFKDDLDSAYSLFDNCMLASDGASLDVHELTAALNRQSLTRITGEVPMKLLSKIDGSVAAPVSIVMQFDALDEVAHRRLQVVGSAALPVPIAAETKVQNPHHALHSEIFGPLLAQVAALQHVSVVVVASSTQPWLGAASPCIHQISVDDDAYLPAEDLQRIIAHKIKTDWPTCKWAADVVSILCRLIPRQSPDLRFFDTRCGFMVESAKKWLQSAPALAAEEMMPTEFQEFLQSLADRTDGMSLAQVVQVYIFQEMHFAFPEADLSAWEQRVNVAFDALVLAAFFGTGTDLFRTDLFHLLVCSSGQTREDFENLLREVLCPIMLSAPRYGRVQFQPDYIDAFRSSASPSGGFSDVRNVMALVYSRNRLSSTEQTSLLWLDKLGQRFDSDCFSQMSQCFAQASSLCERAKRILAVHAGKSRKLAELPEEFCGFMTRDIVGTCCPCALQCILLALDDRVSGSGCAPNLKFYSRVCERLSRCAALDKCAGLLQYQSEEVAHETAGFLKSRVCCFEGERGRQIARLIEHGSGETSSFLHVLMFLHSNVPGFGKTDAYSQAQQLIDASFSDFLFYPAKLLMFVYAMRVDPRTSIEHIMRECGLNETNIWNVRLISEVQPALRLDLFAEMKRNGVPQDVWTRTFVMTAHRSDQIALKHLMDETRSMNLHVNARHWSLYMNACSSVQDKEECMQSMKEDDITPSDWHWNTLMSGYRTGEERHVVLLRMVEVGVTPNEVSWNTLMKGFADDGLSLQCLACFCRMEQQVAPDAFTLSILFSSLVRDGSDGALRTVAHLAARFAVSSFTVNHFVACPVLSALAFVGSDNDILSFWSYCAKHLSRSIEGWPGAKNGDILQQRCSVNCSSGWVLLRSLLDGNRVADGAPAWPPAILPQTTNMMVKAGMLAAISIGTSRAAARLSLEDWPKLVRSEARNQAFVLTV
jgi:hypothetical protein